MQGCALNFFLNVFFIFRGRPSHPPAGVGVELLALPQTRLWTLSALTQAGIGVQGLVPGTVRRAHAAAQLVIPPLASRTRLPLTLPLALALA